MIKYCVITDIFLWLQSHVIRKVYCMEVWSMTQLEILTMVQSGQRNVVKASTWVEMFHKIRDAIMGCGLHLSLTVNQVSFIHSIYCYEPTTP